MEDHRAQLQVYIQQQLGQGVPTPTIRQQLINTGWDSQLVDEVLHHASNSGAPTHEQATDTVATVPGGYPTATHGNAAAAHPQHPQATQDHPIAAQYDQSVNAATQKYKVFQALGDSIKAAGQNPLGILVGVVLYLAIAAASTAAVFILGLGLLFGGASFSESSNVAAGNFIVTFIGIYLLVIFLGMLLGSFLNTILAISFHDGAEHRRTPIGQLLSTTFKRLLRVTGATLLSGLAIGGPLIIISMLSGVMALGARGSDESSAAIIGILGGLAGLVWAVIATFRFALAPYVAMFEPETKITKTLSRSKHLLQHGGQWFLLKGLLLAILLYIILAIVSGGLSSLDNTDSGNLNILGGILNAMFGILFVGVLTLLYRNRRLVRG